MWQKLLFLIYLNDQRSSEGMKVALQEVCTKKFWTFSIYFLFLFYTFSSFALSLSIMAKCWQSACGHKLCNSFAIFPILRFLFHIKSEQLVEIVSFSTLFDGFVSERNVGNWKIMFVDLWKSK